MPFWGRKKKVPLRPFADSDNDDFLKQLSAISRIQRADERLYALEELKDSITAEIRKTHKKIEKSGSAKSTWVGLGGIAAAFATSVSLIIPTGGASVFLFAPGVIASEVAAKKLGQSKISKLEEENKNLFGTLESRKRIVSNLAEKLLEDHLEDIAKSPLRETLFEDYPDLRISFAMAAAKKISGDNETPPKPNDPQP